MAYGDGKCWRCGRWGHIIWVGFEMLCERCRSKR